MRISTIGTIVALGAFALPVDIALAEQVHLYAVQKSDVTLADQVATLQAQVKQLTAQVQSLTAQLAQTTKTANDANFKAGVAMAWINANGGKKVASGGQSGTGDGAAGANTPPTQATDTWQNQSYPASATTLCTIADVHSYPDRMHIRCYQAVSGKISFFATEIGGTVAAQLQVLDAMKAGGLANKVVTVTYAPDPGQNPAGCLTTDCRRLLGTK